MPCRWPSSSNNWGQDAATRQEHPRHQRQGRLWLSCILKIFGMRSAPNEESRCPAERAAMTRGSTDTTPADIQRKKCHGSYLKNSAPSFSSLFSRTFFPRRSGCLISRMKIRSTRAVQDPHSPPFNQPTKTTPANSSELLLSLSLVTLAVFRPCASTLTATRD